MKNVLIVLMSIISLNHQSIFRFKKDVDISQWRVVNDGVMGGLSKGYFSLDENGNGIFSGIVSLENNGGFSMVRYNCNTISLKNHSKIRLKVKGDGKKYQFRIKSNLNDYHSYIGYFTTNGNWQEININLNDMYPAFRGRKLNIGNFDDVQIEQIAFLIGNKKAENFKLIIKDIDLVK